MSTKLMKFKSGAYYKLVKLKAHNPSPYGYPDSMTVGVGKPRVSDMECLYMDLNRDGDNGFHWFRTSPIQRVLKIRNGYQIETMNSTYQLTEI